MGVNSLLSAATIRNMRQYPRFEALKRRDRQRILDEYPDFLANVARRSGKSKATVSRVFAGLIRRSPDVKQAVEEELAGINDVQFQPKQRAGRYRLWHE